MNIGDIITFGRPNGVRTRGKVVKVNSKTVKVKLLEPRGMGRGCAIGTKWTVAKSLCRLVGAVPPADAPIHATGFRPENETESVNEATLVQSAISKLTAPERMALRRHFVRIALSET